jgi:hypothetical protein
MYVQKNPEENYTKWAQLTALVVAPCWLHGHVREVLCSVELHVCGLRAYADEARRVVLVTEISLR